jgi:hypothetical protein
MNSSQNDTANLGAPTTPHTKPVEEAWRKFVEKFLAFKQTPHDEEDKKIHKAWENALNAANGAAYAVIAEPATCLHDMDLKIQAWGFTSSVKVGDDLTDLANWQPHTNELNSEFIASLRDDIQAMRRLASAATIAVDSIAAPSPGLADKAARS